MEKWLVTGNSKKISRTGGLIVEYSVLYYLPKPKTINESLLNTRSLSFIELWENDGIGSRSPWDKTVVWMIVTIRIDTKNIDQEFHWREMSTRSDLEKLLYNTLRNSCWSWVGDVRVVCSENTSFLCVTRLGPPDDWKI